MYQISNKGRVRSLDIATIRNRVQADKQFDGATLKFIES